MGASHSGESTSSEAQYASNLRSYNRSLAHYRKMGSKDKLQTVQRWKEHLLTLLTALDTSVIPYWEFFQEPLLRYIEIEQEHNISWIANLQCSTLNFPTYNSQFSAREETPVLDVNKCQSVLVCEDDQINGKDKVSPIRQLPGFNRSVSDNSSVLSDPRLGPASSKSVLASKFMSFVQNERKMKQDFRLNLSNQVSNSAHIVTRLIKEFLIIFDKIFKEYRGKFENIDEISEEDKKLTESVPTLIKHFVTTLKEFMGWIYKDLIRQVEAGLDQEDVNPGFVIESLLYEMLHKENDSTLTQLSYSILQAVNKEDEKKFKEALERMKEMELKDYDDSFPGSLFILQGKEQPYEKAIKTLQQVKSKTSPYSKFEVIKTLEQDLMDSINEHYIGDPQMMQKVKQSFGMDQKIPILTYCIVRSQNTSLLIDKVYMEEFVQVNYLDTTPCFSAFSSCVDYLLSLDEKKQ